MAKPKRQNKYRQWGEAAMLAAAKKWHRLKKEWPRQSDWDSAALRASMNRHLALAAEAGARLAEYEHSNEWPPARHFAQVFGSFNNGIRAAGGVPRSQGQHTSRGAVPSLRAAVFGSVMGAFYIAERDQNERAARRALRRIAEVATDLASGLCGDALVEYAYEVMGHE